MGKAMKTRKLKESVAVITGASSGIGRATALDFASRGASVVLASRRAEALADLVTEIERQGGRALAVPTDGNDQQAVVALANRAVEAFGRIDIWVNHAGVILFGRFADTPAEDFRKVIETNFFGQVHGARAVLPIFRGQTYGTLINVASVDARVPQVDASAYTASKHAIRSFGMNLRQELLLDGDKDIHVVTILPMPIDTPIFQHGGNYTGKRIKAPRPVYPAEEVVEAMIQAVRNPKPEIYAGGAGRLANLSMKLMPRSTERTMTIIEQEQEIPDTSTPSTSGNLFIPSDDEPSVSGGWRADGSGAGTLSKVVGVAAVAVPLVAIGRRLWRRDR